MSERAATGQGYSRLAWALAQRSRLDCRSDEESPVRAWLTVGGVLLQGWGTTTTTAQQALANNIDKWGSNS